MIARRALPALVLLAAACASATSNPNRERLQPVALETKADEPRAEPVSEALASLVETEPLPEAWADETPVVGIVGDLPIELPTFLARMWVRENEAVRDVLENLVMKHLALLEAERLGVALGAEDVDAILEEALTAMRARIEETGSTLTVDEYVGRNLGMNPGFYRTHLRDDAIVQLLMQRCVRAWALEEGRVTVQLLDLDEEDANAFRDGKSFEDLALEQNGGERLELVRSERNELARLAFATEVGEVGGPLVRGGTALLLRVLERREGVAGPWSEVGDTVLESLEQAPVEEREFIQWRAAMIPRYRVNLDPFADLVGDPGP